MTARLYICHTTSWQLAMVSNELQGITASRLQSDKGSRRMIRVSWPPYTVPCRDLLHNRNLWPLSTLDLCFVANKPTQTNREHIIWRSLRSEHSPSMLTSTSRLCIDSLLEQGFEVWTSRPCSISCRPPREVFRDADLSLCDRSFWNWNSCSVSLWLQSAIRLLSCLELPEHIVSKASILGLFAELRCQR